MIFNTSLPASGGSSQGWTDISSEFGHDGSAEIYAITDGTLVYVTAHGSLSYVTIPSGYEPVVEACGLALLDSMYADGVYAEAGTSTIMTMSGNPCVVLTVTYPIA